MKTKHIVGIAFVVVALLVVGIKGCTTIGGMTYSEGERSGVVTKFSQKGALIKTWEGELSMGGFTNGGKASVWEFSVSDPAVVEKIHHAQRAGGQWVLKYRQQYQKQSWKGMTEYFVVDVFQTGKE
jgi:hypothetical protein